MSRTVILKHTAIANKIRRIAYQIYEVNANEKEIIIAGIERKGFVLAERIAKELKTISNLKVQLCNIKINKKEPLEAIEASLDSGAYINKSVILVDDVLNSGSTLMYAVRYFLATPLKQLKTAVLVDRNHKKYPIKVDYKGLSLSTSIQDNIKVVFSEKGDYAYLE